jgi:phosphate acetyltransferase
MGFIENIIDRAKKDKKKIVLPESMDQRIIDASEIIVKENIADLIIIGNPNDINNSFVVDNCTIIDPNNSMLTDKLINEFYELRKNKGLTIEEARKLILEDYMYYACMLVKLGYADGVVSGVCHSTSNTLRPALQIIKTAENVPLVSAFFLMECTDDTIGDHGTLIFADSGLVEYHNSEELSDIAGMSALSFKDLVVPSLLKVV